ncbi:MAG TPA: hypothetical protein VEL52_05085 [Candidatus Bathyarchaeia archaeon]|nr:hypothetical protein [Candidatus Bathyarchaeia archaeon]
MISPQPNRLNAIRNGVAGVVVIVGPREVKEDQVHLRDVKTGQ